MDEIGKQARHDRHLPGLHRQYVRRRTIGPIGPAIYQAQVEGFVTGFARNEAEGLGYITRSSVEGQRPGSLYGPPVKPLTVRFCVEPQTAGPLALMA